MGEERPRTGWGDEAAAPISPASQLSPGPRLNEVQLRSKIHRSHQEAGTRRGKVGNHLPKLEPCAREQTAEEGAESGDSGTGRRGSGRWRTELECPQNLGEGCIIATKGKCLKEGCCQLCQYRRLFLKMWF